MRNAHPALDHQRRQPIAVDEDDALSDLVRETPDASSARESAANAPRCRAWRHARRDFSDPGDAREMAPIVNRNHDFGIDHAYRGRQANSRAERR